MNNLLSILSVLLSLAAWGQSFSPSPGNPGSTAIAKDSSILVNWATNIQLNRGYLNVADPGLGFVTHGHDTLALGVAEGDGVSVVSLGDGGTAVLTFEIPIMDGPGPDFAVFENGFTDNYMELAHVEVSSDGINFFRFVSVSETPLDVQINNFMYSDCRYVHNLAGKYRQGYGTPFDLQELAGTTGLDIQAITHVKIIDVIGSIDPTIGTFDGFGNIINDPYPTEFESGGFDLDGVGVIHEAPLSITNVPIEMRFSPNPTDGILHITFEGIGSVEIVNSVGQRIRNLIIDEGETLNLSDLPKGIYFISLVTNQFSVVQQIQLQ